MQVYIKKEDKRLPVPETIAMLAFLIVPPIVFICFLSEGGTFMEKFESYNFLLPFSVVFFLFGLWFLYSFLKSPKGYRAKLISKEIQNYQGNTISYMRFDTASQREQNNHPDIGIYLCYTLGENNLVVGNEYNLIVKEYTKRPKSVEEINSTTKIKQNPGTTMMPVFWAIEFIFGSISIAALVGVFMHPDDAVVYILASGLNVVFVLGAYKMSKIWRADNPKNIEASSVASASNSISGSTPNSAPTAQVLSGVAPFHRQTKKLGEPMNRYLVFLMVALILFAIFLAVKNQVNISTNKAVFGIYGTIAVMEVILLIAIFTSPKQDQRFMRRHNITTQVNVDLKQLHDFKIVRSYSNYRYPRFLIIDSSNNLIFRTKIVNSLTSRYAVVDLSDIQICDIKMNSFSIASEFIIRIAERPPFSVRARLGVGQEGYVIAGRDYAVEFENGTTGLIIRDQQGNNVARITPITNSGGWNKIGNIEVNLNTTKEDILDIMMLSLCINMINQRMFNREMNSEH